MTSSQPWDEPGQIIQHPNRLATRVYVLQCQEALRQRRAAGPLGQAPGHQALEEVAPEAELEHEAHLSLGYLLRSGSKFECQTATVYRERR